jgi:hypothetical protein
MALASSDQHLVVDASALVDLVLAEPSVPPWAPGWTVRMAQVVAA